MFFLTYLMKVQWLLQDKKMSSLGDWLEEAWSWNLNIYFGSLSLMAKSNYSYLSRILPEVAPSLDCSIPSLSIAIPRDSVKSAYSRLHHYFFSLSSISNTLAIALRVN